MSMSLIFCWCINSYIINVELKVTITIFSCSYFLLVSVVFIVSTKNIYSLVG